MEQRPLRLGDILDDYCPRERRVTNHAVVAMIEDHVKQTRCTACEAEHAYKGARLPKRRKKEDPAALFNEVLAGMQDNDAAAPGVSAPAVRPEGGSEPASDAQPPVDVATPASEQIDGEDDRPAPASDDSVRSNGDADARVAHASDTAAVAQPAPNEAEASDEPAAVEGPVHRRLIRATLPRVEGQKDARPAPEFTVRQSPTRGNYGNHQHGSDAFRGGDRVRQRGAGGGQSHGNSYGAANGNRNGNVRFQGGSGAGRSSGSGRPPLGRSGGPGSFRGGSSGPNKRGRGPRG